MSDSRRLITWKLAALFFAVTTAIATVKALKTRGMPIGDAVASQRASGERAAARLRLRMPMGSMAHSEAELIARLHRATRPQELVVIIEALGQVGSEQAVRALAPLAGDRRELVATAAVNALGAIATEDAVDVLLEALTGRPVLRYAVVAALGQTGNPRARSALMALAGRTGNPAQGSAITALARFDDEEVVGFFATQLERGNWGISSSIIYALGSMSTPSAAELLAELAESSDARIRVLALANVNCAGNPELEARLMKIARTGDPASAAAAVQALGRSSSQAATKLLTEVSQTGPYEVRSAAVRALGEIGGQIAETALAELVRRGDRAVMNDAVHALATIGSDSARALLIDVAMTTSGDRTPVMYALQNMSGPDVEAVFLDIVRSGRVYEREVALSHLVSIGSAEAMDIAVELATNGPRNLRQQAMNLLAQTGGERARQALVTIAEKERGASKIAALELLAQQQPDDPAVGQMLMESLFSGRQDESSAAAWVLARAGTTEAREALLAAMQSGDSKLGLAVTGVLAQLGNTPEVKSALIEAARSRDRQLSQTALQQLIGMGAPEAVEVAASALRGSDAEAAQSAAWALVNAGLPAGRELLVEAANMSNPQVRQAAIQGLLQAGDGEAVSSLIRMTRDADTSVQSAAFQALGQVGSSVAMDALLDVARSGSAAERAGAVAALGNASEPRAESLVSELIRERDESVALAAIYASHGFGDQVDSSLLAVLADPNATPSLRSAAASQLRNRGTALGDKESRMIDELIGADAGYYGGYGYGGYHPAGMGW